MMYYPVFWSLIYIGKATPSLITYQLLASRNMIGRIVYTSIKIGWMLHCDWSVTDLINNIICWKYNRKGYNRRKYSWSLFVNLLLDVIVATEFKKVYAWHKQCQYVYSKAKSSVMYFIWRLMYCNIKEIWRRDIFYITY